ncbi:RNA polymerase sigma factor SigJ [Agromyces seonyuensis]|uniref:Sigma-70 family RNA polymerase sigma factor n=1 Tax=Agromyces seonyuensis TaxID=2662446 RepID=A0A6I4NWM4_9MICO|nr:RNA polymerase sigma factor SigJ [Agromyces seonyuensis]MWB98693.1 sigma-70 family RNA polymerase sigma factor [Agromyces seonyuensis]
MSEPVASAGPADPFLVHRGLLFTVAYELLGSAADAEDVLQESWLRWAAVDQDAVRAPRAYLVQIVTRQALNHLRTLSRRREEYVGEWLPEPLLTSPDVAEDAELAEHLSIAMLTVLETLGPAERAVFVLREVFDVPYDEIADAVGKSLAAVRQIAHRARSHVEARRPKLETAERVDASHEHAVVVDRLIAAMNGGDMQAFLDVLAPDVVAIADGGGKVDGASRVPIVGALRLARYLFNNMAKLDAPALASAVWLNGEPAIRIEVGGTLAAVVSVELEGGLVGRVFTIANPDKLGRVEEEADVGR